MPAMRLVGMSGQRGGALWHVLFLPALHGRARHIFGLLPGSLKVRAMPLYPIEKALCSTLRLR